MSLVSPRYKGFCDEKRNLTLVCGKPLAVRLVFIISFEVKQSLSSLARARPASRPGYLGKARPGQAGSGEQRGGAAWVSAAGGPWPRPWPRPSARPSRRRCPWSPGRRVQRSETSFPGP